MLRFLFTVLLSTFGGIGYAQTYPSQAIKIIVPFGPGGSSDIVARAFGQYLFTLTGQPVLIENMAGANGIIATQFVKSATPDGYTLELATNTTHAANVSLYKSIPYDPMNDFENISPFGISASVAMVSRDSSIKSIADLVAYSKANPGKVFFGYYNAASQITAETFRVRTGAPMTGIGYKAIGNAVSDLMGGHIQVVFMEFLPAMAQVNGTRLLPLGVTTATRYKLWPNVPAIAETYPGFDITFHLGLAAPAGTPIPIVNKLHDWVSQALADPAFNRKLEELGMLPLPPMTRKDYINFSAGEIARWSNYVKSSGLVPQ